MTRNRLEQFLNEKDGNEKYRREGLKNRVLERLRNNVTEGKGPAYSSKPKPVVKLTKEEIRLKQMEERNKTAKKRADKRIFFTHENVYNYLVGYDTKESTKLDQDVEISDDAKKIEKKAKQAKAKSNASKADKTASKPQQKKQKTEATDGADSKIDAAPSSELQKRKQSEYTKQRKKLFREHDKTNIRLQPLEYLVGGQPFFKHLLLCIDETLGIRNACRLEGQAFFDEFLAKCDSDVYNSLPQLVEELKKFAVEFIEKNCPEGPLREKRLESVRKIRIMYKTAKKEGADQEEHELDESEAEELAESEAEELTESEAEETKTKDGKRKKGSKKSAGSNGSVKEEDAIKTLKEIVRQVFLIPAIHVSLLST